MQTDSSLWDADHPSNLIDACNSRLEALFCDLQEVAARIAAYLTQVIAKEGADVEHLRLSEEARALLQREIIARLGDARWCDGAGFANYSAPSGAVLPIAPGGEVAALQDSEYWTLEWWVSEAGDVRQVPLESDQGRQRRVDFRSFDWFREPADRGRAHVAGPYVDYVCNGSYTVTAAHPVFIDGLFAGVGVADILVSTIEREMSQLLRRLAGPAVIVNPDGRVVVSTEPSVRPGALWPADDQWQVVVSPNHPFRLAVSPPKPSSLSRDQDLR